jgi:8-oxo-dGTP pyrophosphatase MutT (NUDIX family)
MEECAVREIKEETGLQQVELKKHLITTWHTYDESGHHILKETAWYLLSAPKKQALTPQTVEQITQIEWVNPEELNNYLSNTFPAINDVLKAAGY